MSFTIHATEHTGITVADLDRALEFWTGALGFALVRRGRLDGDFAGDVTGVAETGISIAVLEAPGGHRIELLEYTTADRDRSAKRPCDPGAMHLAFTVDDIEAVLAAVAVHGFTPPGRVRAMPDGPRAGTRFVYLTDPDGTTVELIQPA
ncbi:VOC family protein [Sciscionella sediminilitoris]|uniref:VOC family protein n=1 Tax=Sciscionella sediminilitoris TaxID=1445613 RepID=UPI0004DF196A|nr:VOC family protein [Sciscionella sp. SE31]